MPDRRRRRRQHLRPLLRPPLFPVRYRHFPHIRLLPTKKTRNTRKNSVLSLRIRTVWTTPRNDVTGIFPEPVSGRMIRKKPAKSLQRITPERTRNPGHTLPAHITTGIHRRILQTNTKTPTPIKPLQRQRPRRTTCKTPPARTTLPEQTQLPRKRHIRLNRNPCRKRTHPPA